MPEGLNVHDSVNFEKHFQDRYEIEKNEFGILSSQKFFQDAKPFMLIPKRCLIEKQQNWLKTLMRILRSCLAVI